MKAVIIILLLGITGISSGCATLTTGTTQNMSITTEKDVTGARCELIDSREGKWYISGTPGSVTVRKGDGPMTITCTKEGYKPAELLVEEKFAGATLGNVIIGGGIGVIIDAASGSAQKYPDQVIIWMEPEVWESEQARIEWQEAKKKFEAELAEKTAAKHQQETVPL